MPQIAAVVAPGPRPIDAPDALVDVQREAPEPRPHDLIVEVRAVSVNPVDVKRRASVDGPTVLGYDAAGVVTAVGAEVTLFRVGDAVMYAGDIGRDGSDAALQAVDERIVGRKPTDLDFADAAALPLTSLTAWEGLFDVLRLPEGAAGDLLLIGAAGGVGSMVLQLARALLPGVRVIATAGRADSREWAERMGAGALVGHGAGMADEVRALAPDGVDWVFTTHTPADLGELAEILKPFGRIVATDDFDDLDVVPLKPKAQTFGWEFMFARPTAGGDGQLAQHRILQRVADLVDDGRVESTATVRLSPIDAATLIDAHRRVESGGTIGKVVVSR